MLDPTGTGNLSKFNLKNFVMALLQDQVKRKAHT